MYCTSTVLEQAPQGIGAPKAIGMFRTLILDKKAFLLLTVAISQSAFLMKIKQISELEALKTISRTRAGVLAQPEISWQGMYLTIPHLRSTAGLTVLELKFTNRSEISVRLAIISTVFQQMDTGDTRS